MNEYFQVTIAPLEFGLYGPEYSQYFPVIPLFLSLTPVATWFAFFYAIDFLKRLAVCL